MDPRAGDPRMREPAIILTPADPAYPAALRAIPDPPSPLYVRGRLRGDDRIAVAVVGTRRPSPYGAAAADRLANGLARWGITVVSGLARGIDGVAHRAALRAGGRTIAVLGCGLDIVYPPEHAGLAAQIVQAGAVITEYPAGTPPLKHQFPRRNRLISGLTLGVVVVEGRDGSGALITADCALDQGREVFAVPGSIFAPTSALPHRLLRQGATLVTTAEDILDELRLPRPVPVPAPSPSLAGSEATLFAQLSMEPLHIDMLALRCGLPVAEASGALLALEFRGLVRALPGQRYVRAGPEG
jgi:DNA processing protein